MNRREVLKKSAITALGISFSPAIWLSLESCTPKRPTDDYPQYLSAIQFDTIWLIAELIIPRTDSPGADDAGVAPFIDLLFDEYFEDEDRLQYEEGLNQFIKNSEEIYAKPFLDLDQTKQTHYLQDLDNEEGKASFFKSIKGIILWAYFTSEQGMKSMNYLPVPGRYNGCITINDQEKNLVGNR